MSNVLTTPQGIDGDHHEKMVKYLEHADGDPIARLAISEAGGGAFGDVQQFEDGPDVGAPPISVAKRN